jgi:predicted MPP superfamily phosphohydrolase
MRRLPSFLVFLSMVLTIWGGMHYFVWSHLAWATALPAQAQGTIAFVLFGLAVATFVSLLRVLPRAIAAPLWTVAFVWAGFVFLLFFLFFGADILFAIGRHVSPGTGAIEAARTEAAVVLGLAVMLTLRAFLTARGDAPVRRVEVTLDRLPKASSGFSIVQVTDLHISPDTKVGRVRRLVDRVNALAPDLIALTGDLVDGSPEVLREAIQPLSDLRARHGTFFVTGNHEYFSGADRWIAAYRALGVRVLHNERVAIGNDDGGFDLAGVPDWRGGSFGPHHQPRLAEVLAGRPAHREVVLLAHQPRQFAEAAELDVGLQISGHTHGGQIWPFTWIIRLVERWVSGLYRIGRSQLYVSRGTGFWGPPMRLAAPPEITHITLKAAAAA